MHQLVGFDGRTSNDRLLRGSERVVDYSRLLACEEFVYSQASKMPQDLKKQPHQKYTKNHVDPGYSPPNITNNTCCKNA